jgi:hypothetical protein
MSYLSELEHSQIAQEIENALKAPAPAAAPMAAAALPSGADAKTFFCQNWGTVRTVLSLLKGFVPGPVGVAIDLAIKGGDAAQKVICH